MDLRASGRPSDGLLPLSFWVVVVNVCFALTLMRDLTSGMVMSCRQLDEVACAAGRAALPGSGAFVVVLLWILVDVGLVAGWLIARSWRADG